MRRPPRMNWSRPECGSTREPRRQTGGPSAGGEQRATSRRRHGSVRPAGPAGPGQRRLGVRDRATRIGRSGGAVGANHGALVSQLAAVVHQEAALTGEFVGLARQDANGQFLGGKVGAGKVEFGLERVGLVPEVGRRLCPAGLQSLEALLLVVIGLDRAWSVVVGSHLLVLPLKKGGAIRCVPGNVQQAAVV